MGDSKTILNFVLSVKAQMMNILLCKYIMNGTDKLGQCYQNESNLMLTC